MGSTSNHEIQALRSEAARITRSRAELHRESARQKARNTAAGVADGFNPRIEKFVKEQTGAMDAALRRIHARIAQLRGNK